MDKKHRNIIRKIIDNALTGNISLKEFYEVWPIDENNEDEFCFHMFEDIETAIEHTPFKFFANKVNEKVWENMNEYKKLLFYKSILSNHPDA